MIKSELGRFYVGDPCYVLSDKYYHDIWGEQNNYNDGQIKLEDDKEFIVHGTAWGDGEYYDQFGNRYGVDSGTLSVIPLEAVGKSNGLQYGKVFEGTTADLDYYDDGVFTISVDNKNIIINTGDEVTDYDEDDYEEAYREGEDYEDLDESKNVTESNPIYNHDNETCPKCGSTNYVEVDQDEYDDYTTYKLICSDCGYESETRENFYESKSLKENATEEYWDAKEITRDGFVALLKFNFGTDSQGNNYIITKDANDIKRFYANSDKEAIEVYNKWKNAPRNEFEDYVLEEADVEINEDEDLIDQLLSVVDVEAVPERINEILNKISPSKEPYITSDWIYDEIRVENEPLTPDEEAEYELMNVYIIEDVENEDIHYVLDPSNIYHKTIKIQGREFDLMFRITDYYNCVIKIYDIVEE